MKLPAFQIQAGDLVDLEADPYADPRHDKVCLQCEYAEVAGAERETDGCVRIDFEGLNSVGFPPHHLITVRGGRYV